jgi:hypothetical protein
VEALKVLVNDASRAIEKMEAFVKGVREITDQFVVNGELVFGLGYRN